MDPRRLSRAPSRTLTRNAALIILAATLAGCLDPAPKLINEPAPAYFLQDTAGEAHYAERYQGRALILDFFSTWCLACRDQFRELAELRSATNVSIISVGSDPLEKDSELDAFARDYGATWPVARDTTGLTSKTGIRSLPGIVVIDSAGSIRYRHEGTAVDAETLRAILGKISTA